MVRRLVSVLLSLFAALLVSLPVSLPAIAATCSLEMSVSCSDGTCTAVTKNTGSGTCSGEAYSGWFGTLPSKTVRFDDVENSLGLDDCIDSGEFGEFVESPIAFCYGPASLGAGQSFTSQITLTGASADYPLIAVTWFGNMETGEELASAYAFVNIDQLTCTPSIAAPSIAQSGTDYTVSWSEVADPQTAFVVEESTSPDFTANVVTATVSGFSRTFRHDVTTAQTFYYRVRPVRCQGSTPAYSPVAKTVVQPRPNATVKNAEVVVPLGSFTPVEFPIFIPGPAVTSSFTATIDKPYLDVTPKSGTITPAGITLTITAKPGALPAGANTGTLRISMTSVDGIGGGAATTAINVPVSISLVTPVMPGSKSTPPANAMIIPVVTHANGAAGPFLSDVRLTNASGSAVDYQVTMTPTETDGRTSSKVTEITVDSEQTIALNDIVKNFFGFGATDNPADFGFGSLEIRPLNTSSSATYASSRTYASTALGTFGQFIAAVPFSRFATQRIFGLPVPGGPIPGVTPKLSLQQIAQSPKFRTNLGLVEGAGEEASGLIRVFNALGDLLKEVPYSLKPGEHVQWNRFLETRAGIPVLEDGRLEITVDSQTGAVSAYASVLDNVTTDPLAVMPVDVSKVSATRYVLPGIAELPGQNNFHSDLRVYNGGTTNVPATLTYYPQGNGTPLTAQRVIRAGEVLGIDNVLPALFNTTNTGGSIVITTPSLSSLVATGRTYTNVNPENPAAGGTYGQFIPGVTPDEGIGQGDRPLQVLQLEQSDRFRSNLGLAELTGQPASVRLSLTLPDSKVTPSVTVDLAGHEFRQLGRVIEALIGTGTQSYNARVVVEVVSGSGRVTAYGSVIDNESKDPTYVPAQ